MPSVSRAHRPAPQSAFVMLLFLLTSCFFHIELSASSGYRPRTGRTRRTNERIEPQRSQDRHRRHHRPRRANPRSHTTKVAARKRQARCTPKAVAKRQPRTCHVPEGAACEPGAQHWVLSSSTDSSSSGSSTAAFAAARRVRPAIAARRRPWLTALLGRPGCSARASRSTLT